MSDLWLERGSLCESREEHQSMKSVSSSMFSFEERAEARKTLMDATQTNEELKQVLDLEAKLRAGRRDEPNEVPCAPEPAQARTRVAAVSSGH